MESRVQAAAARVLMLFKVSKLWDAPPLVELAELSQLMLTSELQPTRPAENQAKIAAYGNFVLA